MSPAQEMAELRGDEESLSLSWREVEETSIHHVFI